MRDQYAGDISDVIKFAFLRSLAGEDKKLGIAWYYVPHNDGKPDGRHLEWRDEPAWRVLDPQLHLGLSTLNERSVWALENTPIWPAGVLFHRLPMPRLADRDEWFKDAHSALADAEIVFLDPDNGIGKASAKHATLSEIRALRRPGRAIVFITFPGRNLPHSRLLERLHQQVAVETGSASVATMRTNISVPTATGSRTFVQRQRWFTVVDGDETLLDRMKKFAVRLSQVPRVSAVIEVHEEAKASLYAEPEVPISPKPSLPLDILVSGGFEVSSRWALTVNGDLALERPLPKAPGVYSFVKNGIAQYVGLASMGLAKRIYFYARPGITQRTSQRLNAILKQELGKGSSIEILTIIPPDLSWQGLPINGSAGLELGLIKTYGLPWNLRSAG